ncbi:unnamed protein product [Onchocerca ochengi]|uniref:Acetyltransf_18 domain-containing protein n=1 Tax=Onchocerca ochengi TaxID=42157 RepID=A0A182E6F0_ONCOC|nr:unnamed protein product [Onchocerca ochengi]
MVETGSVCQFMQHTEFSSNLICDHFLPDNNNVTFTETKNVKTVIILDNSKTKFPSMAAYGAMHLCANNQAYLMFCKCDLKYAMKSVSIEECEQDEYYLKINKCCQRCMKIRCVWNKDVHNFDLPTYSNIFEDRRQQHLLVHVFEQLINVTLKTHNIDLNKNITVDLDDIDLTDEKCQLYRDLMGFIITDNTRYFQITIEKSNLQAITANKRARNAELTYLELNSENECHFFEYDSIITFMNRHDYLEFLYHINGVFGLVAIEKQQPVGYVLALNNHILQCYANTPEISCDLIRELSDKLSEQIEITMFMRECNNWICKELLNQARKVNRIHRFHSRILPTRVKWQNVFLMNIGIHLF